MPTAAFSTISDIRAAFSDLPEPDAAAVAAAGQRDAQLTKPPGALGRLEPLAAWYCGWRQDGRAVVAAPQIAVFAGNHGITAQGVSAFPSDVTAQMVGNFQTGGAAINQLAGVAGATLSVHPIRLDAPTADFTSGPAMSDADLAEAMSIGWDAVGDEADVLVVGEMGIGNTTAAAALAAALYGGTGADWVGRGTGVDDAGLARKAGAVDAALALHGAALADPVEALRRVGGRELAAMTAAILRARHLRIPVILDGFICTAAAAVLAKASPGGLDHCVAGHVSAESGHPILLKHLGLEPLLSLGLRLGEGSGGAVAIAILRAATACHSGMATFAEAGVSEG